MSVERLRRLAALEAVRRPVSACSCRTVAEMALLIDFYERRVDGRPVAAGSFEEAQRITALCSCPPDPRLARLSDDDLRAKIAATRELWRQAA